MMIVPRFAERQPQYASRIGTTAVARARCQRPLQCLPDHLEADGHRMSVRDARRAFGRRGERHRGRGEFPTAGRISWRPDIPEFDVETRHLSRDVLRGLARPTTIFTARTSTTSAWRSPKRSPAEASRRATPTEPPSRPASARRLVPELPASARPWARATTARMSECRSRLASSRPMATSDRSPRAASRASSGGWALQADGLVGPKTWDALDELDAAKAAGNARLPQAQIDQIVRHRRMLRRLLATHWKDRGKAPKGYTAGIALCFALAAHSSPKMIRPR